MRLRPAPLTEIDTQIDEPFHLTLGSLQQDPHLKDPVSPGHLAVRRVGRLQGSLSGEVPQHYQAHSLLLINYLIIY